MKSIRLRIDVILVTFLFISILFIRLMMLSQKNEDEVSRMRFQMDSLKIEIQAKDAIINLIRGDSLRSVRGEKSISDAKINDHIRRNPDSWDSLLRARGLIKN